MGNPILAPSVKDLYLHIVTGKEKVPNLMQDMQALLN